MMRFKFMWGVSCRMGRERGGAAEYCGERGICGLLRVTLGMSKMWGAPHSRGKKEKKVFFEK